MTAGDYYEQFKKQREEKQKAEEEAKKKKEEEAKKANEEDMFDPLSYLCA